MGDYEVGGHAMADYEVGGRAMADCEVGGLAMGDYEVGEAATLWPFTSMALRSGVFVAWPACRGRL